MRPTVLVALCLAATLASTAAGQSAAEREPPVRAELVAVQRIWDAAPHNAFTDLVRWRETFYCAFREGRRHAGDVGVLRVLSSADGETWGPCAVLAMPDHDLRDAALSVTPDDRLMVLGGAQVTRDGTRHTSTFVSFSADGAEFTVPRLIGTPGRWLWRVTWHEQKAWGVSYATPEGAPFSSLLVSDDGITYETRAPELRGADGRATEARVRFARDGTALCLHRRDETPNSALLGQAEPPYAEWQWQDLGRRFGGPNFLAIPGGEWIAAGRLYDGGTRTELCWLDVENGALVPLLRLPSGGDTSYPGMVWHDGELLVSYYSSHEGKACIYLARVRITPRRPVREIGSRRELFVDTWLIDRLEGDAHRRLHAPTPREQVLTLDEPWEGRYSGYFTVIADEADGAPLFRMYYRGMPEARHTLDVEVTCYAESRDGVRWQKPALGLFEVRGTRENNVVLARHRGCHNFAPFVDRNPACPPEARYKALGGTGKPGLIAFRSPDGIHWHEIQPDPVLTKGAFDSQNVSFWSVTEGCYVAYFRVFRRGVRWIARASSADFVHWSEPVDLEFGTAPPQHLYTSQLAPYVRAGHLYLGTPTRFLPGRKVLSDAKAAELGTSRAFDFRSDCADIVLHSTRGQSQLDRSLLEAFVRPGLDPRNWTSRANYAAHGIVRTGEQELSLYVNHNCGYPSSHVRRYALRPDGFVSVQAGFAGGELLTHPLVFAGQRLYLNCSTSAAGGVRVELQDPDGTPLPGYGLDDCPEIIGDELDRAVSWVGQDGVGQLAGRPVRLRVWLRDADLFALRFGE